MKTTKFFTAIVLAVAILFSACNKTESGDTDVNNDQNQTEVEVPDYTYDESTKTYTVYTAAGLLAWNIAVQDTLELNCTLTRDIDLTDSTWTLVGNYNNPYTGTFEGSGHTITGLTIDQEGRQYVGLIGGLGAGGVVQNLTLDNVSITGSQDVGGVVGYNYSGGTVTSCIASGTIKGNGDYVGGVVGRNYGTVTNCSASGTASNSNFYVGGVVGYNYSGGTVIACYASGSVSGDCYIGGVAGRNGGTVIACYHALGSVSGNEFVGGVAGGNSDTVTACYWSNYDGDGIGNGSGEVTKVDGTTITWETAVYYMNQGIDTWNSNNPDNQCEWTYELTGDLPTLTK